MIDQEYNAINNIRVYTAKVDDICYDIKNAKEQLIEAEEMGETYIKLAEMTLKIARYNLDNYMKLLNEEYNNYLILKKEFTK